MDVLSQQDYFDPPRFTVNVSEFTISSQMIGHDHAARRAEFVLTGPVSADYADAESPTSGGRHPLVGRRLSVAFLGDRPSAEGPLGWIQVTPSAPEILATARIVGCPRRIATLRATAYHAAGPMGGHLQLALDVALPLESEGPVMRIPIRDAVVRSTRRFADNPAPTDQATDQMPEIADSSYSGAGASLRNRRTVI
ncbi:MAG: hypothetical protein MI741_20380 [Rhodospirillales bacterium]|nr:hypothetical protein [Rhodospirillales bacterium]